MPMSVIGTTPEWMMKVKVPQHGLLVASSSPEGDMQGIAYIVYVYMLCPIVVLMACQLQRT